jgi:hypothetical protein
MAGPSGPQRGRELVAGEDRIRGKCRGTFAQRIGNPSLAFGPIVAATARGTLAQGQNFGQRNKRIEVCLDSGGNELTSARTCEQDLEHENFSSGSPRFEAGP